MKPLGMTVSEFHKLPASKFGWRTLPDGRQLKIGSSGIDETALLGDSVEIGDGAVIGATTQIGPAAQIGRHALIGDSAVIGQHVEIGHFSSIRNHAKIGQFSRISDCVAIGDHAEIGELVTILRRVRIGDTVKLDRTPLQIQGPDYLLYPHSPGRLGIGCKILTFEQWEKHGERVAEDEGVKYADYRPFVEIMIRWMKENMP